MNNNIFSPPPTHTPVFLWGLIVLLLLFSGCRPDALEPVDPDSKGQVRGTEENWPDFTYPEFDVPPLRDSTPMTGLALFQLLWDELQRGEQHDWQTKPPYFLWSAVVESDSVIAVGYKPAQVEDVHWESYDPDQEDWRYARAYTIGFILQELNDSLRRKPLTEEEVVMSPYEHLPILHVRVHDYTILAKLRQLATARYVAPSGYVPEAYIYTVQRSGSSSGCSERTSGISTTHDLDFVAPNSAVSWHIGNATHRVPAAWNVSPQGNGITVALIDTGVDPDNDHLDQNGLFTSGQSGGRTIQKLDRFTTAQNDPDDQCGHGTRMAGLIAHPRNGDGSITGVAYRANLISYRMGNNVIINSGAEKDAVALSVEHAADQSAVNILSMSVGKIWPNSEITDAIEYAYWTKGKMIFAAAGSAACNWATIPTTGCIGIFPAKTLTAETIAVTGLNLSNSSSHTNLDNASGNYVGSYVDFGIYVENDDPNEGRSHAVTTELDDGTGYAWSNDASAATATCAGIAALVWSVDPNASRAQVLSDLRQAASMGNNRDNNFGWGVIDAEAAAIAAATAPPPPPLTVAINGPGIMPTSIQSSGTYTWTAFVGGATSGVTYSWDGGTPTSSSTYSRFVSVPHSGSTSITINVTVTEQGGLGRSVSNSLYVPVGGGGAGLVYSDDLRAGGWSASARPINPHLLTSTIFP